MRCPFCSNDEDRVVDSREAKEGTVIRRRRECLQCGRRFTSYERIEEIALMVVKRDGTREPFDRHKLLSGVRKACEKRPIRLKALEAIVDEVEGMIQDSPDREIATEDVGLHVMKSLRDLDKVAYVRFASVYRRFEDVNEFVEELKDLLKQRK